MAKYDFDSVIDRRGTGAVKTDGLKELFGRDDLQALWVADMDFAVAPAIREALRRRFEHPVYGYPYVADRYWDSIRGWLRRRHGWNVAREEMIYVPGVVKAIGFAINYFTQKGDGIIIQPPVYHPFRILAEGNERRVLANPLVADAESGLYRMDLEALERLMERPEAKMMILCNPHNPAGIQWDSDTLSRVASMARRHGVIVVSDEIHADLMLYGTRHVPFASVSDDAAEVAVTFGAPSKTFNIAGLVSSWCVIKNPELREGFFRWMNVNEFDAPTFVAMEATVSAYNECEDWLDEMLRYVEGTVEAVEREVARQLPAVRVVRPQASFLIWLDCRGLGLGHDALIDLFVNRARLALNDGAMFGMEGSGFMRLNVGEPRSEVLRAIGRLAEAIRDGGAC